MGEEACTNFKRQVSVYVYKYSKKSHDKYWTN